MQGYTNYKLKHVVKLQKSSPMHRVNTILGHFSGTTLITAGLSFSGLSRKVDGSTDFFGFEGQSEMYQKFRPTYPAQLLQELNSKLSKNNKHLALDIACGSGQLTFSLHKHLEFDKVIGIDTSQKQLEKANQKIISNTSDNKPNIEFILDDGCKFSKYIDNNGCDLVCIAQALHWFIADNKFDDLCNAIDQILRRQSIFAVLGYGIVKFDQNKNEKMQNEWNNFYINTLGSYNFDKKDSKSHPCYWEVDRKLVDFAFKDTKFDAYFDKNSIETQWFYETKSVTFEQFFGYVKSISAYNSLLQEMRKENQVNDPLIDLQKAFVDELQRTDSKTLDVTWPFFLITMTKKS